MTESFQCHPMIQMEEDSLSNYNVLGIAWQDIVVLSSIIMTGRNMLECAGQTKTRRIFPTLLKTDLWLGNLLPGSGGQEMRRQQGIQLFVMDLVIYY